MNPYISICIPAKNRVHLLRRLLDSIASQNYKDYEIIITDNSDDDAVEQLTTHYPALPIRYYMNNPKTEMGGNWNECMLKATGKWVKIIHDDDWFVNADSLGAFAAAAAATKAGFIFSHYYNTNEDSSKQSLVRTKKWRLTLLKISKFSLLSENIVGPPSTTMVRKDIFMPFQSHMKWIVDIEWYIRMLHNKTQFQPIKQPLINIYIHEKQATNFCFRNAAIEIPEFLDLLAHWKKPFKNIFVYDYCWRLIRNLEIRNPKDFYKYASNKSVPSPVYSIIKMQKRFPVRFLQKGIFSKIFMCLSWGLNHLKKQY